MAGMSDLWGRIAMAGKANAARGAGNILGNYNPTGVSAAPVVQSGVQAGGGFEAWPSAGPGGFSGTGYKANPVVGPMVGAPVAKKKPFAAWR